VKKLKHTPGPWKTWDRRNVDQGVLITDQGGSVGVCRVIGESQKPPTKNAKAICGANALLIAAAPEMLELLVRFMEYEDRGSLRVDVNRLLCRLEHDLLPAEQPVKDGGS